MKTPYLKVVEILFKKLKTFNKHNCFGENVTNAQEALENIIVYGSPDTVKKKFLYFNDKYGELSSIVYVNVPETKHEIYKKSLEMFAKYV